MANQKNIDTVKVLSEKLARAKSVVFTDYRGLTHKQSEELHKAVKKVDGELIIAKNSLLRIASSTTAFSLLSKDLAGPTAALFAYVDEISPLKELFKTIKTLNLPKVKFGFIGNQKYSDIEIEAIAKLPGQEILRGQLVSRLNSPIFGFVYTLNYNIQKLTYVLSQIKK